MADEIEIVSDDDGAIVAGERSAVERFLKHNGLLTSVQDFSLSKLSPLLKAGSGIAQTAAEVAEQSAVYLRLTPDSAKRLKEAGGLMKTKTKGISHAMLGETGKDSLKWLQVEDGAGALLSNPAVLSGVGGLMSQFAQQAEARELKELLVRIDEKLDEVRRAQRDAVLARMRSSAGAIDEAMILRANGGDPKTTWDKVSGVSESILNVQDEALLALGALADKVEGKRKTGQLKKITDELDRGVAIQLAVLARCFELQDQFRVVELDHVLATAPENLEGHRRGVAAAREKRRSTVVEQTSRLMEQMDAAGGIANANIILHAGAARAVVGSLNSTAASIDEFHSPLGIVSTRIELASPSRREAFRDRQQRANAGKELGQKTLVGLGTAGALALTAVVGAKGGSKSSS